ncbi:hypothetical protein BZG36_05066 [Bifiguratus adelaidae]|uniref:PLD phosphodiesterase domain-containing protein n=1 Tax=Bifiguratus adelaidae TaxID=1938954 RepID=A0A261XVD3_9FUNG|nr:hypothetical protein BZG36_05066 [Bifiguratus adelaidae]
MAALSVQEQEDADLALAIALSLGQSIDSSNNRQDTNLLDGLNATDELSLTEGKEFVETEQLLRKRKRVTETIDLTADDLENVHKASSAKNDGSSSPTQRRKAEGLIERSRVLPSGAKYPKGVIKLTNIPGYPGDYTTFADLVDKDNLEKGLLTAMIVDPWMESQLPHDKKIVLVKQGLPYGAFQKGPYRVIVHPPMMNSNFGCMHAKLMVLWFKDFVRIVIGSANLMKYDYDELENVLFIQDFPRLTVSRPLEQLPEFGAYLLDFVEKMGVPETVLEAMRAVDYTEAKARLVASISGVHDGRGTQFEKYGHPRLRDVVQEMGASCDFVARDAQLECQTSSMGALNKKWLNEFYGSACGHDPFDDKGHDRKKTPLPDDLPPIKVVYPTLQTVQESNLGPNGACTICFSRKLYTNPNFPRHIMRDCLSRRRGCLMHSKWILCQFPPKTLDKPATNLCGPDVKPENRTSSNRMVGWFYCGSHNFTASAWGRVSLPRGSHAPKLTLSNWELGVVHPVFADEAVSREPEGKMYWDLGIPINFVRPLKPYFEGEEPWMYGSA